MLELVQLQIKSCQCWYWYNNISNAIHLQMLVYNADILKLIQNICLLPQLITNDLIFCHVSFYKLLLY